MHALHRLIMRPDRTVIAGQQLEDPEYTWYRRPLIIACIISQHRQVTGYDCSIPGSRGRAV